MSHDTNKKILTLHLGQAGVQMGSAMWEQFCLEHNITPDGTMIEPNRDDGHKSFFTTTYHGKNHPRCIMVDFDQEPINKVFKDMGRGLFSRDNAISGSIETGNCFARGYNLGSNKYLKPVLKAVRKNAEAAENLQGFLIQLGMGGGMGSGFGARLDRSLCDQYPKNDRIYFSILPPPEGGSCTVEAINTLLFASMTMENRRNCNVVADNAALRRIFRDQIGIEWANMTSLNRVIAQVISVLTASLRFRGNLNAQFSDILTNAVPFPDLAYPIATYSPFMRKECAHSDPSVMDITAECFSYPNYLVDINPEPCKILSGCIVYRGDVEPKAANDALKWLKGVQAIKTVPSIPTTMKVAICKSTPRAARNSTVQVGRRCAATMLNTTAVAHIWEKLLADFNTILRRRAFLHWYLSEGMEMDDFEVVKTNISKLIADYYLAAT